MVIIQNLISLIFEMVAISVIMPVYNGEVYLHDAIRSVLKQSFKNFELIIIDDNSSDKSIEVINSFPDNRIKLISNRINRGAFACYNIGIKKALANIIAFADQDDINQRERLSEQLNYLNLYSLNICASNFNIINTKGKIESTTSIHTSSIPINEVIIYKPFVFHNPTVMAKKTIFDKYGFFDETFKIGADYKFYLNISRYEKLTVCEYPLYNWRYHKKSYTYLTKKNNFQVQKEIAFSFLAEYEKKVSRAEIAKYRSLIYYYSNELLRSLAESFEFLRKFGFEKEVFKNLLKILVLGPIIKLLRHSSLLYKTKRILGK